jgi:hypothetical protein
MVRAWEGLYNTGLRTDVSWLTRASKWIDEGAEIVPLDGSNAIIRVSDTEIGKIVDEQLLPTKYLAGGNKIDDAGSGYDFYKLDDGTVGFRARFNTSYDFGEVTVKLEDGTQVGSGGIGTGGFLESEIQTVFADVRVAKGENVFNEIFDQAGQSGQISGVRGVWTDALSTNLDQFNELIRTRVNQGLMTLEDAALDTFTGQMARNKGFNSVLSINGPTNPDGTYVFARVEFSN